MINDYYKILGLNPNCTIEEVKKAYKFNAKKYHPDLNQSISKEYCQEKMKQINFAYDQIIKYIKNGCCDDNSFDFQNYDLKEYDKTNQKDNSDQEKDRFNSNNQEYNSTKYGRYHNRFKRKNTWGYGNIDPRKIIDLNYLDSSRIYVGDVVRSKVDWNGKVSYNKICSNYILYHIGLKGYFNISLYLRLNADKRFGRQLYVDDLPQRYIIQDDVCKPYNGDIIAICVEKLDLEQNFINIDEFKKDINFIGGIKKKLVYQKR